MQRKQRALLRSCIVAILLVTLTQAFWSMSGKNITLAHAENNGAAPTPFMGWSTWNFDGYYPTESNVEAQANVEASKLKAYGYNYILLDDFWYSNPSTTVDGNGYWVPKSSQFPNGLAGLASYVHELGLKMGFYLTPGIPVAAVNQTPIVGTGYHARDIADTSHYEINYNYGGGVMYAINYSKPGAQAYINGWADQLASWGADFLKVDGVGDGDISDIKAWSQALNQSGRSIVFDLSNSLDINNVKIWQQYANAWRIDGDVECYCSTQVTWGSFSGRFNDAARWAQYAGPGGWNDLDALQISDGAKDGITNDERQTYMTLWAIEAAPLYAGDDLTTMDSYGLSLLTNTEVIAVDQAGHAVHPVSQASNQQVWYAANGDGSYTVALFNLGGSSANVTANWSNLGFSGSATVRDLWSHTNLGTFTNSFSATLNTHASRLFKVVPGSSGGGNSYEAESSANTLGGRAVVVACSVCSGGAKVGYVGLGGTLKFNAVQASSSGTDKLTIYYVDGDAGRTAQMSVNGGTATTVTFHGTNDANWNFVQSMTVSVPLNAGNNTILFSNASASAPDFDRITVASTPTPTPNPSSGYYEIVNRNSGQVLDVTGNSTSNGGLVVQWTYHAGTNQQWQEVSVNGGYKLINRNSGLLLDNPNSSKTNGTQLDQWSDTNGSNQWWNLVSAGGGYYYIVNQSSGLYADVAGSSTTAGASVVEWPFNGGTNQQWQLIPV